MHSVQHAIGRELYIKSIPFDYDTHTLYLRFVGRDIVKRVEHSLHLGLTEDFQDQIMSEVFERILENNKKIKMGFS